MATEPPDAWRRRGFPQVLSDSKDGESETREVKVCLAQRLNCSAAAFRLGLGGSSGQQAAPALQRSSRQSLMF